MRAVRITIVCDELIRIEYSPSGTFCDWPSLFAVHGPGGEGDHPLRSVSTLGVEEIGRRIECRTERIRLIYEPDGREPGPTNMRVHVRHDWPPLGLVSVDGWVEWKPGIRNRFNLGGTLETLDGVRGQVDIGEGLLARDGWHLVDDSHQHVLVHGWARTRHEMGLSGNSDWYFFGYGDDFAAGMRALARIAGRVPLPRKYALGSWYSRYWPHDSAEYRQIVQDYHLSGFPLDVVVLDMDWHREGWTGWSWNRELLPDAEQLLGWMRERGLAVTLNLHPAEGVGAHEDRYVPFMRHLGRNADGHRAEFDSGNREYMNALFEEVLAPLERNGVDFWWVDWQQDRYVRSIPGLTNLRWLNQQFFEQSKRINTPASDRQTPLRGLGFSRFAGWGDHRHPIHFSGDAHTGWKMLAFQVPFTVLAGNVGCFYWSHDIGGHFGPRNEEATARWVQFGAMSAALRLHSARSGSLDRRPWTYESLFAESMRHAFALRARLMPYIYTCARESYDESVPLLRPMYFLNPRDERAYHAASQYMIGADVLVAPIVAPGAGPRCAATRHIWFPADDRSEGAPSPIWYDWWSGEPHAGGDETLACTEIDRMPLYVRGGAPLPLQTVSRRMAGVGQDTVVIRVFPGEPGTLIERWLYEDDGVTAGYESNAFAKTRLRAEWNPGTRTDHSMLRLRISGVMGDTSVVPKRRRVLVELAGISDVVRATSASEHVAFEIIGMNTESTSPSGSPRMAIFDLGMDDARSHRELCIEFAKTIEKRSFDAHRLTVAARAAGTDFGGPGSIREMFQRLLQRDTISLRGDADWSKLLGVGVVDSAPNLRLIDAFAVLDAGPVSVETIDRIDGTERVVSKERVSVAGKQGRRAFDILSPKDILELPPVGVKAERRHRLLATVDGRPVTLEWMWKTRRRPLDRWLLAGPFTWDWRWSIVEHGGVFEERPLRRGDEFDTLDGRQTWTEWNTTPGQPLDFLTHWPHCRGLGYAWTQIESSRAQKARMFVEAPEKIAVWVNSVQTFVQFGADSPESLHGEVEIDLKAGLNDVLVKVSESGGGWYANLQLECSHEVREVRPGTPSRL